MSNPKKFGNNPLTKIDKIINSKLRVKKLLSDMYKLDTDPHFTHLKNGLFSCNLCLTTHKTEYSYISHKIGKKHRNNCFTKSEIKKEEIKKIMPKHLAYKLVEDGYQFKLFYKKENDKLTVPVYKFISSYEQNIEPRNDEWQYLIIANGKYETVGFKIENKKIKELIEYFDHESFIFTIQILFENE